MPGLKIVGFLRNQPGTNYRGAKPQEGSAIHFRLRLPHPSNRNRSRDSGGIPLATFSRWILYTESKSALRHDRSVVPYGTFPFCISLYHRLKPVATEIFAADAAASRRRRHRVSLTR